MPEPKITIVLTLEETTAVVAYIKAGGLLTKPDRERDKKVQAVLARIGKRLVDLGASKEQADRLLTL